MDSGGRIVAGANGEVGVEFWGEVSGVTNDSDVVSEVISSSRTRLESSWTMSTSSSGEAWRDRRGLGVDDGDGVGVGWDVDNPSPNVWSSVVRNGS